MLAGSLAAAAFPATRSHSQTWPARPIKMVVPYTAGWPTDFVGRLFAGPMGSEIGQRIYIENQLGAEAYLEQSPSPLRQPTDIQFCTQQSRRWS